MTRHLITERLLFSLVLIFLLPLQMSAQEQDLPDDMEFYDYATSASVTIGFSGGTVSDFVKQLTQQAERMNILIRADVANITLPAMSLRNITADTALNSLIPLSMEAVSVMLDDSQEYYIVGPNYDRQPEIVEVLNVGKLLFKSNTDGTGEVSPEKQDQLLSAIEAGQQMLANSSETLKIKLHEQTGLLFVKGSPEQTELVKQIVGELYQGKFNPGIGGGGAPRGWEGPGGE